MKKQLLFITIIALASTNYAIANEQQKPATMNGFKKLTTDDTGVAATQGVAIAAEGLVGTAATAAGFFVARGLNHLGESLKHDRDEIKGLKHWQVEAGKTIQEEKSRIAELSQKKKLTATEKTELKNLKAVIGNHIESHAAYPERIRASQLKAIKGALTRGAMRLVGPIILADAAIRGSVLLDGYNPKVVPLVGWSEAKLNSEKSTSAADIR